MKNRAAKLSIKYLKNGEIRRTMCLWAMFLFGSINVAAEKIRYFCSILKRRTIFNKENDLIVNGIIMGVDLKDIGLSKDLLIYGKREPNSTEHIKRTISENEQIIDIGANLGYYALLEANLAPKGRVAAIEPVTRSRKILEENIRKNGFKNIEVFPLAISDERAKREICVYDKMNFSSFIQTSNGKKIATEEVQTITLDEFVSTSMRVPPSFIRMDVEGHEYEVIKGAKGTLRGAQNLRLYIELHPHLTGSSKARYVAEELENNGFHIEKIFIEPVMADTATINMGNYFRSGAHWRPFGEQEEKDFGSLKQILEEKDELGNIKYCPHVFFQKTSPKNGT